jgi:hypothetical protein
MTKSTRDYSPGDDEEVQEDLEPHEDEDMGADDSMIPTREVVEHVVANKTAKHRKIAAAGLVAVGEAENDDAIEEQTEEDTEGLGKRKRRTNTRYAGFWRHANDKGDDIGVPGIDLPAVDS